MWVSLLPLLPYRRKSPSCRKEILALEPAWASFSLGVNKLVQNRTGEWLWSYLSLAAFFKSRLFCSFLGFLPLCGTLAFGGQTTQWRGLGVWLFAGHQVQIAEPLFHLILAQLQQNYVVCSIYFMKHSHTLEERGSFRSAVFCYLLTFLPKGMYWEGSNTLSEWS